MSAEWNGADTASGSARLAPAAFSSSQALSTPALRAGDDGLLRVVEVGRLDDLAQLARGLRAACDDGAAVEAEDRRHRAGADRHRLLHRLGAKAHQRQRVGEAQRAGGDERRVFAERVAGDDVGRGRRLAPARRDSRRRRRSASPAACSSVRSSCSFGPSWIRRPTSSPSAAAASSSVCAHHRMVAPARRACRRTASPGRERRKRTASLQRRVHRGSVASDQSRAERRAPGEAAADAFEHHRVAALDLALAHRLVERERDRRGRGVAVPVDGDDQLLGRRASASSPCSA